MVMPNKPTQIDAATGPGTEEGRRPTIVPGPVAASPELSDRPIRRKIAGQDKLRILAEIDQVTEPGGIGAILRREGIYSSMLSDWRRLRDAGSLGALTAAKRGPKVAPANPLAAELTSALRSNTQLQRRLDRAEAIIEIQKKISDLLGLPPVTIDEES
jgi:transposase-like protein